jgi:hypothetical protein
VSVAKEFTATTTGIPNLSVTDVVLHVGQACPQQLQVLIGVGRIERPAGDDLRSATVHLERTHRGDDHNHIRDQPRGAALDVEELLHPDVGAETGLSYDVVRQLEGDAAAMIDELPWAMLAGPAYKDGCLPATASASAMAFIKTAAPPTKVSA